MKLRGYLELKETLESLGFALEQPKWEFLITQHETGEQWQFRTLMEITCFVEGMEAIQLEN